jgi:hypothetical protein
MSSSRGMILVDKYCPDCGNASFEESYDDFIFDESDSFDSIWMTDEFSFLLKNFGPSFSFLL